MRPMDEAKQKLKRALELAIKDEEYTHQLYALAAEMAPDKRLKKILRELADQELSHKDKLQIFRLRKLGIAIFPDKREEKNIAEAVKKDRMEFQSLRRLAEFAVDYEQKTEETYLKLAESAKDEEARILFKDLAVEEAAHRLTFERITKGPSL